MERDRRYFWFTVRAEECFGATQTWLAISATNNRFLLSSHEALEGLPEFRTIEEMAACYVTDLKRVHHAALIIWAAIVSEEM
jgi:hypothetical protein